MIATARELARLTGIHPATISALETNHLFLSSAHGLAIRDALGCSLDELFESVDGDQGECTRQDMT